MPIDNPAKLPGAFLFFTIKSPKGNFAAVAYDESIKRGTKLSELQSTYLTGGGANLPYMEKFAPLPADGSAVWQGKTLVSYGGIFGGPDPPSPQPKKRTDISPVWPYSAESLKSPIRHGLYLSYWNFPDSGKGMHTSSISRHFSKGSEVPYMSLYKGNATNLVPSNASILRQLVTEVYVDWYATFDGDLGWDKEVFT